jgi:hypothetical protein
MTSHPSMPSLFTQATNLTDSFDFSRPGDQECRCQWRFPSTPSSTFTVFINSLLLAYVYPIIEFRKEASGAIFMTSVKRNQALNQRQGEFDNVAENRHGCYYFVADR